MEHLKSMTQISKNRREMKRSKEEYLNAAIHETKGGVA
jgi:hypothetical protein